MHRVACPKMLGQQRLHTSCTDRERKSDIASKEEKVTSAIKRRHRYPNDRNEEGVYIAAMHSKN